MDSFVCAGKALTTRRPEPGERILDVGCGCGLDALVPAQILGPTGYPTSRFTKAHRIRARKA